MQQRRSPADGETRVDYGAAISAQHGISDLQQMARGPKCANADIYRTSSFSGIRPKVNSATDDSHTVGLAAAMITGDIDIGVID